LLFDLCIFDDALYDVEFRTLLLEKRSLSRQSKFRECGNFNASMPPKGVWTVGNIGREQGSIWMALISAYLLYPTLYYIADDTMWIFLMVIVSSLCFDSFSKQWRLKPKKKKSLARRVICLGLALALYFAMIGNYLYFNAVITDSEGEEIKLSEAVQHFLTSPIWTDLKVGPPYSISLQVELVNLLTANIRASGESGGHVEPS